MFADPAPAGAAPFRRSLVTFASLAAAPACAPPDHRSVSQITSYSDCGLKYRLQRRDGVPEQPQWASIGGSAFHAAVEQMERAAAGAGAELNSNGVGWQEAGACFDLDQLWLACFNHEISETCAKNPDWPQDSWRASNRGAEGYTWWLAEGVDMLRRYVAWRTEWDKEYVIARAADGTPIIEYEFVLNVDGVPIKGVIDSAWSHRSTGRLIVIDDKSGSRKPDDDLQLRTYGYALLYVAGVPVLDTPESWSGVYFNARKGETSPPVPVITSDGWAELRYRVHAMDAADRAGIHLPRPSSFCGGCGVKYACPLRSR
jgi:putative RecB family exonuclease